MLALLDIMNADLATNTSADYLIFPAFESSNFALMSFEGQSWIYSSSFFILLKGLELIDIKLRFFTLTDY